MHTTKLSVFLSSILVAGFFAGQLSPAAQQAPPQTSQNPPQASPPPPQKQDLTPDEIIKAFSAKETEFNEAWLQYAYRQDAEVKILSVNGSPTREHMSRLSNVIFRDDGTREVKEVQRRGVLKSAQFTKEDEDVIDNLQPFSLTTKELPLYTLKYEGKEKIDELDCYVFSVKPKSTRGGRFYFQGKIWVDDQDLQIVRTVGKPVPQGNQRFPEFETLRQPIDGKFWFPAWTHSDSFLDFPGERIRLEETITYDEYKHFEASSSVKYVIKKDGK